MKSNDEHAELLDVAEDLEQMACDVCGSGQTCNVRGLPRGFEGVNDHPRPLSAWYPTMILRWCSRPFAARPTVRRWRDDDRCSRAWTIVGTIVAQDLQTGNAPPRVRASLHRATTSHATWTEPGEGATRRCQPSCGATVGVARQGGSFLPATFAY